MKNKNNKLPIHPAKRIFDILLSLIILMVLLPFILTILFLIKVEHVLRARPLDPFFYNETRLSHGKPFRLYKFNIFKHEQIVEMKRAGIFIHTKTLENNGGVTAIGWILKQIYMDELPQLFNVLKGDMSIVGPRPVNVEVYKTLMKRGVTAKKEVRAGITGHYQAFKNTSGKKSDESDQEYIDYYFKNPWYKILLFDLKIILRTIRVILRARGV